MKKAILAALLILALAGALANPNVTPMNCISALVMGWAAVELGKSLKK